MDTNDRIHVPAWLSGLDVPATKLDIIRHAKRNTCPAGTVESLAVMPDISYRSVVEVATMLPRRQEAGSGG
ncbi:DUF2795 domain-containing protein, partial [Actinoplanes sp. NPDC049316]|uniref:DUF2795 domain-containing protein n=1 Tax=Actinoplanes sp. NPDC049316 TaxID=3154727 RepID=UPI00341B312E